MMEYDLSEHRFKELKHYCLQYPEWVRTIDILKNSNYIEKRTDALATETALYDRAIRLIEMTAEATDKQLHLYLLRSVTEDISFSQLNPPCDKWRFDYVRRKFYWLLSEAKGV